MLAPRVYYDGSDEWTKEAACSQNRIRERTCDSHLRSAQRQRELARAGGNTHGKLQPNAIREQHDSYRYNQPRGVSWN